MKKMFRVLVYMLPAVLFFSYYPVISFGANETMNFELSLPLIWLVVFAILSFGLVVKEKKFGEIFKGWPFLLLPVFLTLTILWSENRTRGILTAGIFWLIYIAGFSIYIFRDYFKGEKFKQIFWKWFFASAVVVCVWCVVQCVLDLVGVSREYSLMCLGCTYKSFGFPHSNGFAIEPQFMGNLLLAPTIMSGWLMLRSRPRPAGPSPRAAGANSRAAALRNAVSPKHYAILFFIFTATLFLTFSRGAIYAFIVAMMFMTGFLWSSKYLARDHKLGRAALSVSRDKWFRAPLKVWLIVIAAFLFTLNAQGIMAQVSPTSDTYWSGVSKVLNHLSLGIIDVRKASAVEEAVFDGYVAESTDTRMQISRAALQTWRQDFKTVMFGVGLGGAGEAMFKAGVMWSPKEIVQNEYVSLLLETGIVGILFVVFTIGWILKSSFKKPGFEPILILMVAYAVTLLFFAGLPNALHIYLLPVVIYEMSLRKKLVS